MPLCTLTVDHRVCESADSLTAFGSFATSPSFPIYRPAPRMGWIRTCLRDSWPHRVGRVNLAQPYADEKGSTTKGTTALPCYATPIGAACRPDIEASVIASSVAIAHCLLAALTRAQGCFIVYHMSIITAIVNGRRA